jgi:hypothetical protein
MLPKYGRNYFSPLKNHVYNNIILI